MSSSRNLCNNHHTAIMTFPLRRCKDMQKKLNHQIFLYQFIFHRLNTGFFLQAALRYTLPSPHSAIVSRASAREESTPSLRCSLFRPSVTLLSAPLQPAFLTAPLQPIFLPTASLPSSCAGVSTPSAPPPLISKAAPSPPLINKAVPVSRASAREKNNQITKPPNN